MSTNDTYLAVFLSSKTSLRMKAWMALPDGERRAKEQEGMAGWKSWVEKHQAAIVGMGGPLGKTKKVTQHGIEDTSTRGLARGGCQVVREASALHDLSGRVRGGHAGSADTRRLIGHRIYSNQFSHKDPQPCPILFVCIVS